MKGYPKSQFDIINKTSVNEISTGSVTNPTSIMMATYTSDKGEEDWELLYGLSDFTARKGPINFTRHGQAQLSVAEMLRNGSYVLAKRLVSSDATIANTVIKARVIQSATASYLYIYTDPIMSAEDEEVVFTAAGKDFNPDDIEVTITNPDPENPVKAYDVPLIAISALGRGISGIHVRLVPESYASKGYNFLKYSFEISENSEVVENIMCTINPDVILDNVNQSVQNKVNSLSKQIKIKIFEDAFIALVNVLAKTATIDGQAVTANDLINLDFMNGRSPKNAKEIGGIITKATTNEADKTLWSQFKPSDIDSVYMTDDVIGIPLEHGSYGKLGSNPMNNPTEYEKLLLAAWGKDQDSPGFDPVIYDLDANKVDAIFDCAYPISVKNAIIDLIEFRGDCAFLADLGTKIKSIADIKTAVADITPSGMCALYQNVVNIADPYTKKQINVTQPYLLIPKMVKHISNGVGRPFAGIANGITFPDVVTGSVNFLPVVMPGWDQKQELVDMNVNYMSYYDDQLVMETMYTNSADHTQLSYLHNVMAIQEIVKLIRTRCPKTRYTFLDGDDLETYIDDCRAVINEYKTNFKSIDVTYMADERYESNNIFYAVIEVQFKNFVQEEYFKIIAIS